MVYCMKNGNLSSRNATTETYDILAQKHKCHERFVEDLQAAKTFCLEVLDVQILFEDETSVALGFENIVINLLGVQNARQIVDQGAAATRDSGSRFQLSIWIPDVNAVCLDLQKRGVKLLAAPRDRSTRTAGPANSPGKARGVTPRSTGRIGSWLLRDDRQRGAPS
jgi:hypothetical protein